MSVDVNAIADRCVKLIDEATRTGQMTLPSGKIVTLEPDALIRLVQWAAMQRAKKPKFLDSPTDIQLRPTKRTSDAT